MDNNSERLHPNADNAASQGGPSPNQTEPPASPKPPRELLRQDWSVCAVVQQKLVAHHTAMADPDAELTYQDEDGNTVTRPVTAREALRHMKSFHTFGKLALGQQKLDAGIEDQDDENKGKT